MKNYKVVDIAGGAMVGTIKTEKIENEINDKVANGWNLKEAVTYSTAGPAHIILIFEREKED